ncbi:hypothetical protein CF326_g7948 [Tilletia indica]|nr:hypothetical protein CF326_g7948 [Tilletia indica]
MTDLTAAERDLATAIRRLNDTARAAGYKPDWPAIFKKVGIKSNDPPTEHTPPSLSPPGLRFECVSVPTTSLLLSALRIDSRQ